jgi:DNA replication and repair protein RecF
VIIQQLKLNGFRCYQTAELSFAQRINVFYGSNGVGKTSLLEAIYWLSTGKSFRSKHNKTLIKHSDQGCTVFARLFNPEDQLNHSLGVGFGHKSSKQIKLNQAAVRHQSEVAHLLPVVSIDPDSYLFLDKPPQFRRSFLDWLVFHVKPQYLSVWSQTTRCHKQLNVLYKAKEQQQLPQWEAQYLNHANQLNELRLSVFDLLQQRVHHYVAALIPELNDLSLGFNQGWSQDQSLEDVLNRERDKNLLYGNLNSGVHKMDIKSRIHQNPAHEVLSRGQKKLIAMAFCFSFIDLLTEHASHLPVICIDDLDAELDSDKTGVLCEFINQSPHQVFITTVDQQRIQQRLNDVAVFHVKHEGVVQPIKAN